MCEKRIEREVSIKKGKRSQITIFVIIAIVIVVVIALFFILRGSIGGNSIPKDLQPVYTYFESCVQDNLNGAINLIETQGGYIYTPEFDAGNDNFPSSSQMNFFGFSVPYWDYTSASGLKKEQVPSKGGMQEQISRYLRENMGRCDFSAFFQQGYQISIGDAQVTTAINSADTKASINIPLIVSFNNVRAEKSDFEISTNTKLGELYDTAYSVYQKQKSEKFLDNYGVDILRLYAPVDGVEISCAPKIWNPQNVVSSILNATEVNIAAIKFSSNTDYKLVNKQDKYFLINANSKDNIRFMYSQNFPTKIEISPVDNNVMKAEPVGQEAGMGIIGFCYVPYHFVYNFVFPVMIQVYDGNEIFQFPVVADIQNNQVNQDSVSAAIPGPDNTLCQHENSPLTVYTYNNQLQPVPANISFKCFTTECDIGETSINGNDAILYDNFPTCVNGFVIAKADGYADAKQMVSTNEGGVVNVLLDKQYKLNVSISGIGNNLALVNFISDKNSISLVYPEQKDVELTEGDYNVSVYVYKNSTITFPATSQKNCVKIPKSGLSGLLGGTEEQCYDMNIPSQTITFALAGGGSQEAYFIESALQSSSSVIITPTMLSAPTSLDDLQKNYAEIDASSIGVQLA